MEAEAIKVVAKAIQRLACSHSYIKPQCIVSVQLALSTLPLMGALLVNLYHATRQTTIGDNEKIKKLNSYE